MAIRTSFKSSERCIRATIAFVLIQAFAGADSVANDTSSIIYRDIAPRTLHFRNSEGHAASGMTYEEWEEMHFFSLRNEYAGDGK